MVNILDEIVLQKQKEVELLIGEENINPEKPLQKILEDESSPKRGRFHDALLVAGLSIIGEIKRCSPSKGKLAQIEDPVDLSHAYSRAGVSAISVLTDEKYFKGSKQDLIDVVRGFNMLHPPPILRKEFIIDPFQIAESKLIGADAILLIVSILKDKLQVFLEISKRVGLDCLVEVHNEDELEKALAAGATIIGVNNRNLRTFEVDLGVSKRLAKKMPDEVVKIAESGILTLEDAQEMHESGFDGILVGEMLVTSKDPQKLISDIGNI